MSRKDASQAAPRASSRRSSNSGLNNGPKKGWIKGLNKRRWGTAIGAVAVVAVCLIVRSLHGPKPADAKSPGNDAAAAGPAAPQNSAQQKPQVVAIVNGQEISRQELAQECLSHYGKEVLETMVNKFLIVQYCQQRGVTVSQKEVNDEIDRMARKFSLSPDQWVKMLQQERNVTPEQYASDIVWPTLALRKLAADRIQPSQREIQEAFDAQFGEAVKARLIVVHDRQIAEKVQAEAKAHPADFGALAIKYSKDPSASANGMIQPIHHHVGERQIEDVAFQMQPGEISPVIEVKGQFLIFKCEGRLPAVNADVNVVREKLAESVRDNKLHKVAAEIFQELQSHAVVRNVFNDPVLSQQMPGVAATINDHQIAMRELAEECIDRHGADALKGTIDHRLLEQALRSRRLTVTQQEIDAEIARVAVGNGVVTESKQPDMKRWLTIATKERGISYEVYLHDEVWPSVALKKLTGDVKVTQEDMQRGMEANYGPRCRCRVIVMTSQRKAQEVWEMARQEMEKQHPDPDFFGHLAEQYSVDPSRAQQGQVPPIQKYGRAPELEEEAFKLKSGDISGLISIGESFVILYCEGYTTPVKVTMDEVRNLLYDDIHEKKLEIAMAEEFNHLKDSAQIDNALTGESHNPKRVVGLDRTGGVRQGSRIAPANGPANDPSGQVVPAAGQLPYGPGEGR